MTLAHVLQIYDGSAAIDELGFGCGIVDAGATFVSRTDVMIVQFTSDAFTTARGFSARYRQQLPGILPLSLILS